MDTVRSHNQISFVSAQSALDSALHSMDCTDIVMASVVHGDFLHVEDMYTRDRSTPITDNILDGEQSLLSAYGIQRNGRTVVMIRRLIRGKQISV